MFSERQVRCDEINNFEYRINGDEVEIIKYTGEESNVVIPEFIEGKPVVSIAENTFSYRNFDGESYIIESIYIPKTVASISVDAFDYYYIKNMLVDRDNKFYCSEDGVLYTKDKSILIRYPTLRNKFKISDKVIEIHDGACEHCKITSANLPNKLKRIGEGAFAYCTKLSEVNIPDSVTYIGDYAFYSVYTDEFNIPKGIKYLGDTSRKDSIIFEEYNDSIKDYADRNDIVYIPFTKKFIYIFIAIIIFSIIFIKKIYYIKKKNKST